MERPLARVHGTRIRQLLAYYRYVPKDRFALRYNVRYNTPGTFQLPPSRVEAMYAPEMHAELPIKPVTIR